MASWAFTSFSSIFIMLFCKNKYWSRSPDKFSNVSMWLKDKLRFDKNLKFKFYYAQYLNYTTNYRKSFKPSITLIILWDKFKSVSDQNSLKSRIFLILLRDKLTTVRKNGGLKSKIDVREFLDASKYFRNGSIPKGFRVVSLLKERSRYCKYW